MEAQRKWSTTEQEAFGVYYAITKWNYYLQGADIIVRNKHKTLTNFLNGKNTNNKVTRWELKLATYNILFEWISGSKNKAADCLSCLVELPSKPSASINMVSVSNTDGPAFNTRSQTQQCLAPDSSTTKAHVTPDIMSTADPTPKSLTADRLEALLQMQKQTFSASSFLNVYLMERHLSMKWNSSPMSRDSYTNISQILDRSFLL